MLIELCLSLITLIISLNGITTIVYMYFKIFNGTLDVRCFISKDVLLTVMADEIFINTNLIVNCVHQRFICTQLMLCVITIATMYITSVTSSYCDGSIFTVFMK